MLVICLLVGVTSLVFRFPVGVTFLVICFLVGVTFLVIRFLVGVAVLAIRFLVTFLVAWYLRFWDRMLWSPRGRPVTLACALWGLGVHLRCAGALV